MIETEIETIANHATSEESRLQDRDIVQEENRWSFNKNINKWVGVQASKVN